MRTFIIALYARALIIADIIMTRSASALDSLRDRLNGDVDAVLAGFEKLDAKLDRARMAAVREANMFDGRITKLEDALDAAEAAYDARIATAQRAARVQQRLAALLD